MVAALEPAIVGSDVNALLVVDHLSRNGRIDVERAAPVLQQPPGETEASIRRLERARLHGGPVVVPYAGTVLSGLEDEGLLARGRGTKLGRGFFYVPAGG